jgi:flagellar basal-body rod modification protein FlgD
MDTISAVGASTPIAPVDRGFGALDSDEFTRLILTELSNQDPLEPNDTGALLEQLSTIRSIESDTRLNETLDRLVDRSDFTAAAGLIGSRVTTSDTAGATPRTVVSVNQSRDGVGLTLGDGATVPLASVLSVLGPEAGA